MTTSTHRNQDHVVSAEDVRESLVRIKSKIRKTPLLLGSDSLKPNPKYNLFFKVEAFQRTGSFKFRGATNAVTSLKSRSDSVVITVSSGNFAQGAALAAKNANLKARIVMPADTTKVKIDAVKSYGAEVEFCDPKERDAHCQRVVQSLGDRALFIHPSENEYVISGNGTLFLEMLDQMKEFNKKLHVVIVPVGGGGVISGVSAVAFQEGVLVIGAEPEIADDAYRSKKLGTIQGHRNGQVPATIAEGLRTTLGKNTWPCVRDWVSEIVRVSEKEIVVATKLIMERLKVVAEPSSCVALAAISTPEFASIVQKNFAHESEVNIGIVLTGGNVDLLRLPFSNL